MYTSLSKPVCCVCLLFLSSNVYGELNCSGGAVPFFFINTNVTLLNVGSCTQLVNT